MIVSSRSDAAQISSTLIRPARGLDLRFDADARLAAGRLLDLRQQHVERLHLRGRLDLREHQLVEALRRALDDRDDVAVRPLGVPHVDAHAQDRLAPVEGVDRVDDLVACRPASRAGRPRPRGRGTPCRPRDSGPWRASSRSSPGSTGTSGEAGCDCVLTWSKGTVPPWWRSQPAPCTSWPTGCGSGCSRAANRA